MPVDDTKHDTQPADATSKWDDSEFQQQPTLSWWAGHKRESIIFFILLGTLTLVIFGLPKTLAPSATQHTNLEPEAVLSTSSAPQTTTDPAQTTGISALNESPWQDAQLSKARRASQEVLAQLLDKQKQLETLQVQRWALQAFNEATALASDFFFFKQKTAYEI